MIARRSVVAGLAAVLLAPQRAIAQQSPGKIPRVGILTQAPNDRAPMFDAFREGLRDLGYAEGHNIVLEFRFTRGDPAWVRQLTAELLTLPIDVIVPEGVGIANLVDLSSRVPIVSPVMTDPVQLGFAASLAHPGGNITGFTLMHTELNAKRLDLLHIAFPQVTTVSALVNPASPGQKLAFEETETAARSLGLGNVRRVEAESAATLRALRPEVLFGTGAVVVVPDGTFYNYRRDGNNDHCVGSGKDLRTQRTQGRGIFGLDPADIPQTERPGGRFGLLESLFHARICEVHQRADRTHLRKRGAQ